ncbi:hypothetical protein P700755_003304 [Psychroflexus torquis ATCC 700755]|uniref:Uncharacterized protein n=1 Tax=Psychroflexus torquis (strain ATCC 700755 / CIP 106069 / ACAM 623) TaxID=313595 RepID=K4IJF3_PSYTT|nr:hypothetical protein [Psychroflexus torquis]AFU69948.1 hypothetical protein P700755_003304 [Psychroflexus torquis ATCC 700755]
MKNKIIMICFIIGLISSEKVFSQDEKLIQVEYKIIAEGTDSPIPELQIICFNKYFNKDYLPPNFLEKYNLNEKKLYKKKMLIEIFKTDKSKKGLDKIELVGIKEDDEKLLIEYNFVNSNIENDDKELSYFLIIQVPKSKKKITFIANGIELGKATEVYVD